MRVVLKDDETLQSFLFFAPKVEEEEEEEEIEDEDETEENNKMQLPPPRLDIVRVSGRKKTKKRASDDGDDYTTCCRSVKKGKKGKKKPKPAIKVKEEEVDEVKEEEEDAMAVVTCEVDEDRGSSSRWSLERYRKAEMKLMDIVRERGGVRGSPLVRKELREEARKHIGDTGLLDHLLKHTAGKVVSGERFMRRHNPDGAMVYWLEPPVAPLRIEEGSRSLCGDKCKEEITELKKLVGFLNRDMEELRSGKELEKSVWQENYEMLLEKNINLEGKMREMTSSLRGLKENHARLMKRNIILEAEMARMSNSFQGLKEEMVLLKGEKQKEEDEKNAGEVVEMSEDPIGGSANGVGDKVNEKKQLHEHQLPLLPKAFYSPLLQPYDQVPCLGQEQGALEIDISCCSQI